MRIYGCCRLADKAKYGMINMHNWMFLGSFENQRKDLLARYCVDNMLHLGARTFDELNGEVVQNTAYVISKVKSNLSGGCYFRLVDGRDCSDKERLFLDAISGKNVDGILYQIVSQDIFTKIPGSPIGYWLSNTKISVFERGKSLGGITYPKQGLATSDNKRFLRYWQEVSHLKFGLDLSRERFLFCGKKWFPYCKGGSFRKWYGNRELVINWEHDGTILRSLAGAVIRNPDDYFKEGLSYSDVSTGSFALRYYGNGFVFDSCGPMFFPKESSISSEYLLALLNSCVTNDFYKFLCPAMHFTQSSVAKMPVLFSKDESLQNTIESLARINVELSKSDWDAHETSWDFQKNELLSILDEEQDGTKGKEVLLSNLMDSYKQKWEEKFSQLHANEEELNRQFIEIYGLQDELTPDVPLEEVTILQQGEISIE